MMFLWGAIGRIDPRDDRERRASGRSAARRRGRLRADDLGPDRRGAGQGPCAGRHVPLLPLGGPPFRAVRVRRRHRRHRLRRRGRHRLRLQRGPLLLLPRGPGERGSGRRSRCSSTGATSSARRCSVTRSGPRPSARDWALATWARTWCGADRLAGTRTGAGDGDARRQQRADDVLLSIKYGFETTYDYLTVGVPVELADRMDDSAEVAGDVLELISLDLRRASSSSRSALMARLPASGDRRELSGEVRGGLISKGEAALAPASSPGAATTSTFSLRGGRPICARRRVCTGTWPTSPSRSGAWGAARQVGRS